MIDVVLESPLTVLLLGSFATIVALAVWVQVGHRALIYVALALALLTVILIFVSYNVRTDREQLRQVIEEVAGAVQRNDVDAVLKHVHPSANARIDEVRTRLPGLKFTEARVTGLKSIEVTDRTEPKSAVAQMHVAVSLTSGSVTLNGVRRFVKAYFLYSDGKWLINDFEHFDIAQGFKEQTE